MQCPSAFLLHKALHARTPPIMVTMQTVKEYFKKKTVGELSVTTARELQEKYGAIVAAQASPVSVCVCVILIANYKCKHKIVLGSVGISFKP